MQFDLRNPMVPFILLCDVQNAFYFGALSKNKYSDQQRLLLTHF